MSLVAYVSSDEEDTAEEIPPKSEQFTQKSTKGNSFIKKDRESVRITIPSLKEFEDVDVETPSKKPKFQPKSGSGLFSLLPPPKNSTTLSKPGFIPYVLKKKEQKLDVAITKDTFVADKATISPYNYDEEDSEENITNETERNNVQVTSSSKIDFFSLDSDPKIHSSSSYDTPDNSDQILSPVIPFVSTVTCNSSGSVSSSIDPMSSQLDVSTSSAHQAEEQLVTAGYQDSTDYYLESSEEPNPTDALLKDKEFLKLQGRRHEFEKIDIIDVNAADQLLDKNEWLMKSLTEETTHRPSRKKHHMPTSQQKRKHQITYLAFQAKEREMDLKNQWAMNNRTRRETQAKYGF